VLEANYARILADLRPEDVLLDIGGWAQPINRSNYVIDLMPYETRGVFGHLGPDREEFTKDTWLTVDICSEPLPFADKAIDFVICSHTLEDIRDPVRVCRELVRVAKRGYLEVPSRRMESIRNLEHRGYPGYYHHRWLVDIEQNLVTFRFKTPLMQESWRYTFPKSYLRRLSQEDRVSYLFWDHRFDFRELIQISEDKVAAELEAFVRRYDVYPAWRYAADALRPRLRQRAKRFFKRTKRFRALGDRLLGRPIVLDEDRLWNSIPDYESR
jgi:hypothetical protein